MGGYRWMYYLTGLPGWMRFGFSPGWAGRNPWGLGPCAYYLLTGQWPTPATWGGWWGGWAGFTPPAFTREQELTMLRNQAEFLKQQLETIAKRIEEIEKEGQ